MAIDIVAALGRFGVAALDALQLALALQRGEQHDAVLRDWLVVRYDPAAHRADLGKRLGQAAERVVARRRGRPPARARQP